MRQVALLEHVCKRHGHKNILRDINLTLDAEAILLLCGHNGAGKSTLLRLVAGLSCPSSGKISISENIRIGYLGHDTFIYPGLTALENLEFHAKVHQRDCGREHLFEILDRMNLLTNAHEHARIFSRGMAQRLNFARILALDPDILLLDEPFTGLDATSCGIIRSEIIKIRRDGRAIAIVSHNIADDLAFADRVAVLKKGKLEWQGSAKEYVENKGICRKQ